MMMTNDEYDDFYKKVFDLQTNTTRTCIAACDTTYYTQVQKWCRNGWSWLHLTQPSRLRKETFYTSTMLSYRKNIGDSFDCKVPQHGNVSQGLISLNYSSSRNFSNETSFKYIPLQSRSRSVTMDHLLMNISQTWESCIVGKKLVDTCNDVRRGPLEVKDYLWCRSPYGSCLCCLCRCSLCCLCCHCLCYLCCRCLCCLCCHSLPDITL